MKALLIVLLMGTSLTASAIGHPHNLFSAHRKAKAKATAVCRATVPAPPKAAFTATVRAVAPGAMAYGLQLLKKKLQ